MKIVNMSISNYRQFKCAELNFDDGSTVLAGVNNSGKTSLITLIKNVFTKENAISVEELESNLEKYLIPADSVLSYEKVYLTESQTKKMLNGVFDITDYSADKFYRVYSPTEFLEKASLP